MSLNTNEGLEYGPDRGFVTAEVAREREQIKRQTAASKTIRGEQADIAADDFRAAVFGAGSETDIRSGLTYGDQHVAAEEASQLERFRAEGAALNRQDAITRQKANAFDNQVKLGEAFGLFDSA